MRWPALVRLYLRRVVTSTAFYPLSTLWVAAMLILSAVVGGALRLDVGLTLLTLSAVLIVVLAMRRDVSTVHSLVNSQRDELVTTIKEMGDRIRQLIVALQEAGVAVPHDEGVDRDRPR